MNFAEIENASRQAWPALEEQELDYGVLRYSRGVSRRVNSLNLTPGVRANLGLVVQETESFYRQRGLPSIIRVCRFAQEDAVSLELDQLLASQAYVMAAPTLVMGRDLIGLQAHPLLTANESITSSDLAHWLDVWHAVSNKPVDQLQTHQSMLDKLAGQKLCLVRQETETHFHSCGMGVVIGSFLGIFGIATAKSVQGRGYATALVSQLLRWGNSRGARYAYLQVEANNQPALAVYKKLGFQQCYSYWYREKHL